MADVKIQYTIIYTDGETQVWDGKVEFGPVTVNLIQGGSIKIHIPYQNIKKVYRHTDKDKPVLGIKPV
jgi:hypothetical protein